MKIVFFGTPEFAIPTLASISHSNHNLLLVVTNPNQKSGRGLKVVPSPIKDFCNKESINCISFEDFKKQETYNYLYNLNADLFVVVAFKILPEKIINIPKFGSINLHPSPHSSTDCNSFILSNKLSVVSNVTKFPLLSIAILLHISCASYIRCVVKIMVTPCLLSVLTLFHKF